MLHQPCICQWACLGHEGNLTQGCFIRATKVVYTTEWLCELQAVPLLSFFNWGCWLRADCIPCVQCPVPQWSLWQMYSWVGLGGWDTGFHTTHPKEGSSARENPTPALLWPLQGNLCLWHGAWLLKGSFWKPVSPGKTGVLCPSSSQHQSHVGVEYWLCALKTVAVVVSASAPCRTPTAPVECSSRFSKLKYLGSWWGKV